jgi:hypothetical protein
MFSNRGQRIAASAAAAVGIALGAAGVSAAATSPASHARPAVHKSAPAEAAGKPDTDNVQQGDQNAPDGPAIHKTKTRAKAASDTENPTASETDNNSDGPGGHQDPAANVDHQFDGQE